MWGEQTYYNKWQLMNIWIFEEANTANKAVWAKWLQVTKSAMLTHLCPVSHI